MNKCHICIDQDTYDKECEWVGNDEACPKADKFWEDYKKD